MIGMESQFPTEFKRVREAGWVSSPVSSNNRVRIAGGHHANSAPRLSYFISDPDKDLTLIYQMQIALNFSSFIISNFRA